MYKFWTNEEIELLRRIYPSSSNKDVAKALNRTQRGIRTKARSLGISKTPEYLALAQKTGQFVKGHSPMNKGKRWDEWMSKDSQLQARTTTFKKGHLPSNRAPIGTERLTSDGYWEVKVADPNIWDFKHRKLWEQHYGSIPKGGIIYFKDGNRDNVTIENLAITDRKGLRYMNIGCMPIEIKRMIQLMGALQRQINKTTKNERDKRQTE